MKCNHLHIDPVLIPKFNSLRNMEIYFSQSQVRIILENANKYQVGSHLCRKYLYGIISTDGFCEGIWIKTTFF